MTGPALLADLPASAATILREFTSAVQSACGASLRSVILFGSAAEGRLRVTSDLNLLVIADEYSADQLDALRLTLRAGRAASDLTVMFLATRELPAAVEAFGLKFADIKARHRLLFGEPLLEALEIPREAALRRVQQVLLNLRVRLRERFVIEGDHDEQLALVLADALGPVRSSAATLLWLRDGERLAPKASLESILPRERWAETLESLSRIHRGEALPPSMTRAVYIEFLELLDTLRGLAVAC